MFDHRATELPLRPFSSESHSRAFSEVRKVELTSTSNLVYLKKGTGNEIGIITQEKRQKTAELITLKSSCKMHKMVEWPHVQSRRNAISFVFQRV